MKVIRKPIVADAFRYDGTDESFEKLRLFLANGDVLPSLKKERLAKGTVYVKDPFEGYYIIRDYFEKQYDVVSGTGENEDHDMISSHSEKETYDGCIRLMNELLGEVKEWLEIIGVDVNELDPDECFCTSMRPTEIVEKLFLSHTGHSGGTSKKMKCASLGINTDDEVYFSIEGEEE